VVLSSVAAPEEIVQAAENGLGKFLNSIPKKDIEKYGFSSPDEFKRSTLDTPFQVNTILPDVILNYVEGQNVSSMITPTSMWFFPVICDGSIRVLLTVDYIDGSWKAVAIGSSKLAKQLENALKDLSDNDFTYVRVFQARTDFIVFIQNETEKIRLLNSLEEKIMQASTIKTDLESNFYNFSDLMPELSSSVEKNLRQQVVE
jgi:hypothetical protein